MKSRKTLRPLKRKNEGQGTRARAEQNQAPPAVNPVEQRVTEGGLHHPPPENNAGRQSRSPSPRDNRAGGGFGGPPGGATEGG